MTIFVVILHVIVCFVLIGVILLQPGRGQGLSGSSFGGGNVQSVFGTKAADFLTKATTAAAIVFILTCIVLTIMESHKSRSLYQATETTAPLDIEQIKKALEKAKTAKPQVDATKTEQTSK